MRSRPPSCRLLTVQPDATEPIEQLTGGCNVNAALGSGGLTAGFSGCGELVVLKWPGPSYYDQLNYLSSNAQDARLQPRLGALESQGAFAGISYRLEGKPAWHHTWLRNEGWEHRQRYSREDSNVLIHETTNGVLGLRVEARYFVLPDRDVLVNDFVIERRPNSPVDSARLVFYANFAPTQARLPLFPVADWALDFQNDYAVLFDSDKQAFLHFRPQGGGGRNFSALNPLLRNPPATDAALAGAVQKLASGPMQPGVYIAMGARRGPVEYQAGFDDAPECAHQTEFADRVLPGMGVPPELLGLVRALFACEAIYSHPDGPLGECRAANGWTYEAQSAYEDAEDGELSGSPIAACAANAALSRELEFIDGKARGTFYVAAAATRDEAYALLEEARAGDVDGQRESTEAWWADYLAPARLPDTDDPLITEFAKRALISIRTATDNASGAIVASITTQPAYGADWPRDGAFINHALDLAGYHDLVTAHNRFYARVQRKKPGSWSLFFPFPPCRPYRPVYPNCIPAGTFEMNYYADPEHVVPAGAISFEIDEAGLGVWTLWEHAQYLEDPDERSAYLRDVCPAIALGATNLAGCRDPENGFQCAAVEGDNFYVSQGLRGAATVILALESAVAAAQACGFSEEETARWQERARELRQVVMTNLLVSDPPAHLAERGDGAGAGPWALWPVRILDFQDPLALSHARWLEPQVRRVVDRTAVHAGYNTEALVARAKLYREIGDKEGLAKVQEEVRFFVRELTTHDTLHMGEFFVRVSADINGDGLSPDYLPVSAIPHVWQGAYLYLAALDAFGMRGR